VCLCRVQQPERDRTPERRTCPAQDPIRPNHVTFIRHFVGRWMNGGNPTCFSTNERAAPGDERIRSTMSKRQTILSGMRPTGKLHLGHSLERWKTGLRYKASMTTITSSPTTTRDDQPRFIQLYQNSIDMVIDWLATASIPRPVRYSGSPRSRNTPNCTSSFRC